MYNPHHTPAQLRNGKNLFFLYKNDGYKKQNNKKTWNNARTTIRYVVGGK